MSLAPRSVGLAFVPFLNETILVGIWTPGLVIGDRWDSFRDLANAAGTAMSRKGALSHLSPLNRLLESCPWDHTQVLGKETSAVSLLTHVALPG